MQKMALSTSHCQMCQLTASVRWMRALQVMLRQAARQQAMSTSRGTSIPFPVETWTAQAPLLPLARIPLPEAALHMKLDARYAMQAQRLAAGAWLQAVQSPCLGVRAYCSGRLSLYLHVCTVIACGVSPGLQVQKGNRHSGALKCDHCADRGPQKATGRMRSS